MNRECAPEFEMRNSLKEITIVLIPLTARALLLRVHVQELGLSEHIIVFIKADNVQS